MVGDIAPWVGVAEIRFGDSRKALRDRLGEYRSFRRTPDTPPIDHYMEAGMMLGFDGADRLDVIECTDRADPALFGVRLTGRPLADVLAGLDERRVPYVVDDSGCTLTGLGVALYSPAPDEPDVEVEGVAVFSRAAVSRDEADSGRAEDGDTAASPREPPQADVLF
ncbi:hypothetical protein [Streptomyces sp. NPDC006997]|uniref:hypothetical protein n=1 Tax=Streptomyces sp. NPDC006997 TaxID=3155356 RepID=UPI0033EA4079